MKDVFVAVLLALRIAHGVFSWQCGIRIQTRGPKGETCFLNAGHYYASNSEGADEYYHGLDKGTGEDSDEYNVFWQCSGSEANYYYAREWYWHESHVPTGIFTVLPDRGGEFGDFYLDADYSWNQGIDVAWNERNAKVDQREADSPITFKLYNHPSVSGARMVGAEWNGYATNPWARLARGMYSRPYDLVTGERVYGYEAKWQHTGTDYKYTGDNAIFIRTINCGVGAYVNKYNANPILLAFPANMNYIQTVIIGVLLVSLMVFCVCAYNRKSSGKIKYESVKFDSDTDAV